MILALLATLTILVRDLPDPSRVDAMVWRCPATAGVRLHEYEFSPVPLCQILDSLDMAASEARQAAFDTVRVDTFSTMFNEAGAESHTSFRQPIVPLLARVQHGASVFPMSAETAASLVDYSLRYTNPGAEVEAAWRSFRLAVSVAAVVDTVGDVPGDPALSHPVTFEDVPPGLLWVVVQRMVMRAGIREVTANERDGHAWGYMAWVNILWPVEFGTTDSTVTVSFINPVTLIPCPIVGGCE